MSSVNLQSDNKRGQEIEANRRGELTVEQRGTLGFMLEAQLLGEVMGGLVAMGGLAFFGCLLGWSLAQRAGSSFPVVMAVLSAVAMVSVWRSQRTFRRLTRLRAALHKGHVAQAEGQVTWSGRAYAVCIPKCEKLRLDHTLVPGTYRFYYVPYSGAVLSAERLSTMADARTCLLEALMRACRFDGAGLAANRKGRLGQEQRETLKRVFLLDSLAKMLAVLVLGILFAAALVGYQIGRGAPYEWTAVLAIAPFAIVLTVLLSDYLVRAADLREGRVLAVQGIGLRREKATEWYINRLRFGVPRWSAKALITGVRYRAYYLPRSGHLVSIEPLTFRG